MSKSTNAVTKSETALPALPDFMKDAAGLGTEALDASDVEIPRVKLMQSLSPELEEYDTLKAGDFFHTLAEINMGSTVRISPIYIDTRFILWRPQDTGGGILARADDGVNWNPPNAEFDVELKKGGPKVKWRTADTVARSGLAEWGSSNPSDPNSPPAATRMYNMVVVFPDRPELPPAVITLQRSSIRIARRFIGKLKVTRAPSFGLIFVMSSVADQNNAGQSFKNFAFKADGFVENQEVYAQNHSIYKFFKAQGLKVKDLESVQGEAIPDITPADAGAGVKY